MRARIHMTAMLFVAMAFATAAAEPTFKELVDSAGKNVREKKLPEAFADAEKAQALAANDAERLQAMTLRSDVLVAKGEFDAAIKTMTDAAGLGNLTPQQRNAAVESQMRVRYAKCNNLCHVVKDYGKAAAAAKELSKGAPPGSGWVVTGKMLRATAFNAMKEPDKAAEALDDVDLAQLQPGMRNEFLSVYINTQLTRKKYAEALAAVEKALALAGNDTERLRALSQKSAVFSAEGRLDDACHAMETAAKLETLDEAQRLSCRVNLISILMRREKFAEAAAACDQLLGAQLPDNWLVEVCNHKIQACNRMKDHAKALAAAEEFSKRAKPGSDGYFRGKFAQIDILNTMKEFDKAVAVMSEADVAQLQVNRRMDYFSSIGNIQKNQKKYSEAIAAFKRCVDEGGQAWAARGCQAIAECLAAQGDNKAAAEMFAKAAEASPDENFKASALQRSCQILITMGDTEAALQVLPAIVALPKAQSNLRQWAARQAVELLEKQNKLDEALAMIQKLSAVPDIDLNLWAECKVSAGKILLKLKRPAEAEKEFDAVATAKGVSDDKLEAALAELEDLR